MGHSSGCSGRCFILVIAILQLIATLERQAFDFLGYLWLPIACNFLYIICIIIGFFGIYQYRVKYIIMYIVGSCLWIGWNIFLICFYLEAGSLSRDDAVLNLTTGSRSWFEANGQGCHAVYNGSEQGEEAWKKPVAVNGCLLPYYYVECAQSLLQITLSVFGAVAASVLLRLFTKEDDPSLNRRPMVPYSIEYQRHPSVTENAYQQKPMTPRKVKRRSTRARRSGGGSYRPSYYQNPVTKIMERSVDSSTSNDSYSPYPLPPYRARDLGQLNLGFQNAQPQSKANGVELPLHNPPYLLNQGALNMGFDNPLPSPMPPAFSPNGRPSPIYMNDSETVI